MAQSIVTQELSDLILSMLALAGVAWALAMLLILAAGILALRSN